MSSGSDPAARDGLMDKVSQIGFREEIFGCNRGTIGTFSVCTGLDFLFQCMRPNNRFDAIGTDNDIGLQNFSGFQGD
jgi:hypothetical protein